MSIILKILKWTGLLFLSLFTLIILAGLCLRLFSPKPQPPGELVDIGGFKLHINASGEKSNKPTLVVEAGAGLPSEHYYWLGEMLEDSMRVVRYDRAGIGYSDLSNTPRDPKTIACELHTLLEKSGESPPYILAGHSFGGLFIRVFTQLYPDEVEALIFLDSSHPDQRERLRLSTSASDSTSTPSPSPSNDIDWKLKMAATLGDLGILNLADRLIGPLLPGMGVPEEVAEKFIDYTASGKYIRGVIQEEKWDESVYKQSREAIEFGSRPVRVFSADIIYREGLEKRGIDPDWFHAEKLKMHREIADLSTDGQHMLIKGHHNSIYTKKENAEIICQEILKIISQ